MFYQIYQNKKSQHGLNHSIWNDGDFSHRAMVRRINSELANDFGNLAQRVLSMINNNCGGKMPQPGELGEADDALLAAARGLIDAVRSELAENHAFHEALTIIWVFVRQANGYVAGQEPWVLSKSDPERMATVLYVAAEAIRHLAILVQPFMPESCAKMLDQLGVQADARDFSCLGSKGTLKPATALPPPKPIFPRYVDDVAED